MSAIKILSRSFIDLLHYLIFVSSNYKGVWISVSGTYTLWTITRIKVIMHMHSCNRSCNVCLSFFMHLLGYIRWANRKVYGRMTCIKQQRSASSSPPITVHRGKADDGVLCRALETFFLVWNNLAIFLHRGKVCWTNMLPPGCIPTFEGKSFPHKCG